MWIELDSLPFFLDAADFLLHLYMCSIYIYIHMYTYNLSVHVCVFFCLIVGLYCAFVLDVVGLRSERRETGWFI